MATEYETVGEEWCERTSELSQWAMNRLVNRKDVSGQYSVVSPTEHRQHKRTYKAMTLPQIDKRGADMVTLDKLTRHFSNRRHRKLQIIGLHAIGAAVLTARLDTLRIINVHFPHKKSSDTGA